MERIKNFLREKGFVLVLAACVLAAAAVGMWAVRTVRDRLDEDLRGGQTENNVREELLPGIDDEMEADTWQQETTNVAGEAKDVPQPAPTAAPSASSSSSGASSGSGSVSEPSELQTGSAPADAAAAPAYAQPVSGQILAAFSGDELVYNKTLGDWRTHNGTDYGCAEGDSVFAPVSGTVEQTGSDGNWGAFVTIRDSKDRLWRLCGVASPAVKEGDSVVTGQTLGKAAAVGCENALGAHIHLEILEGEKYLDPAQVMG